MRVLTQDFRSIPIAGADDRRVANRDGGTSVERLAAAIRVRGRARLSSLLDDVEAVAVEVVECEHRRNAVQSQHDADLHAAFAHRCVLGFRVGHREPDAGIRCRTRIPVVDVQRDGRGRSRWCDFDPAGGRADRSVEPLLEAESVDIELGGDKRGLIGCRTGWPLCTTPWPLPRRGPRGPRLQGHRTIWHAPGPGTGRRLRPARPDPRSAAAQPAGSKPHRPLAEPTGRPARPSSVDGDGIGIGSSQEMTWPASASLHCSSLVS